MVGDSGTAARANRQRCEESLEHKAEKEAVGDGNRPCDAQALFSPDNRDCQHASTTASPSSGGGGTGCFKDEMLHLLTKKRIGFQLHPATAAPPVKHEDKDKTIDKIKYGLSMAIKEPASNYKPWDLTGGETSLTMPEAGGGFLATADHHHGGFDQYGGLLMQDAKEGSPWNQSMCTGSTCTPGGHHMRLPEKALDDENGVGSNGGKGEATEAPPPGIFHSDCVLWDISSEDLMNPMV
ncbi:unnamed protein product [Cuscuta campestris]|uniref:Uncharacterized protein n=1 Tax=Cuscuta campestris TaxID=132261 RepID=A0A484KA68_9ASTE|nr:unnamed protein product [Cuscuta campestris]